MQTVGYRPETQKSEICIYIFQSGKQLLLQFCEESQRPERKVFGVPCPNISHQQGLAVAFQGFRQGTFPALLEDARDWTWDFCMQRRCSSVDYGPGIQQHDNIPHSYNSYLGISAATEYGNLDFLFSSHPFNVTICLSLSHFQRLPCFPHRGMPLPLETCWSSKSSKT